MPIQFQSIDNWRYEEGRGVIFLADTDEGEVTIVVSIEALKSVYRAIEENYLDVAKANSEHLTEIAADLIARGQDGSPSVYILTATSVGNG